MNWKTKTVIFLYPHLQTRPCKSLLTLYAYNERQMSPRSIGSFFSQYIYYQRQTGFVHTFAYEAVKSSYLSHSRSIYNGQMYNMIAYTCVYVKCNKTYICTYTYICIYIWHFYYLRERRWNVMIKVTIFPEAHDHFRIS